MIAPYALNHFYIESRVPSIVTEADPGTPVTPAGSDEVLAVGAKEDGVGGEGIRSGLVRLSGGAQRIPSQAMWNGG